MKKIQNQVFAKHQNPEGIQPFSPGLRGTSYPGLHRRKSLPTLKGLRHFGRVTSIGLLTSCALALLTPTSHAATEEGFTPIFNGKDLTGWDGNPALWSVKDGAIVGQTSEANPIKNNTFLIWTNGQPGDFELRCSFKIEPLNTSGFANSGIQYRSKVLDPNGW